MGIQSGEMNVPNRPEADILRFLVFLLPKLNIDHLVVGVPGTVLASGQIEERRNRPINNSLSYPRIGE